MSSLWAKFSKKTGIKILRPDIQVLYDVYLDAMENHNQWPWPVPGD